jgi:hypothetical protein
VVLGKTALEHCWIFCFRLMPIISITRKDSRLQSSDVRFNLRKTLDVNVPQQPGESDDVAVPPQPGESDDVNIPLQPKESDDVAVPTLPGEPDDVARDGTGHAHFG